MAMTSDRDALKEFHKHAAPGLETVVLHYLYFPSEQAASAAAAVLKKDGFSTEVRLGALGDAWLLLARHTVVPTVELIERTRTMLEALASRGSGEYDGWEAEVPCD